MKGRIDSGHLPWRTGWTGSMVTPGDAAGSAPDHMKASVGIKRVPRIFDFPVHIKLMFILYCSLLNIQ